jgi:hypothetical protein
MRGGRAAGIHSWNPQPMKITTDEFNDVVAAIMSSGIDAAFVRHEQELIARVIMAVGDVLKHRRGLPDSAEFDVPLGEIPTFLASMSKRQRRLLKKIAEELEMEKTALH